LPAILLHRAGRAGLLPWRVERRQPEVHHAFDLLLVDLVKALCVAVNEVGDQGQIAERDQHDRDDHACVAALKGEPGPGLAGYGDECRIHIASRAAKCQSVKANEASIRSRMARVLASSGRPRVMTRSATRRSSSSGWRKMAYCSPLKCSSIKTS